VPKRAKTFSPGERIAIGISFAHKGEAEVESVEAVFTREDSDSEMRLLGDAKRGASGGEEETIYFARLEAKVEPGTTPGEYRCVRLSARDRFDDDWEFAEAVRLDLVICVERPPQLLEITASDFL
jgi:hypothetical protein